jgi:hypothetical protein
MTRKLSRISREFSIATDLIVDKSNPRIVFFIQVTWLSFYDDGVKTFRSSTLVRVFLWQTIAKHCSTNVTH